MKENKFIVISTVYNKEKWVGFNVNSIKQQSYKNFIAAYAYDLSEDKSIWELYRSISQDERFHIIENKDQENRSCTGNFLNCYKELKERNLIQPEDIIVEVDADDWLLHPFVFDYLNQAYQDPYVWMTYGHYIEYPTGQVGGHFHMHLRDDNNVREYPFAYSHLKTYKAWLFDRIPEDYFRDPRTGKYWKTTADFAICMPMVEMAGKDRIVRFDQPIYVYNRSEDLGSESMTKLEEQKEAERLIRQFKPLEKISTEEFYELHKYKS
jgi:glycosyltransferase involved in cell wall biosynthesis